MIIKLQQTRTATATSVTKSVTSRTIALHVCYKSLFIFICRSLQTDIATLENEHYNSLTHSCQIPVGAHLPVLCHNLNVATGIFHLFNFFLPRLPPRGLKHPFPQPPPRPRENLLLCTFSFGIKATVGEKLYTIQSLFSDNGLKITELQFQKCFIKKSKKLNVNKY